jgi:hypothetical protein
MCVIKILKEKNNKQKRIYNVLIIFFCNLWQNNLLGGPRQGLCICSAPLHSPLHSPSTIFLWDYNIKNTSFSDIWNLLINFMLFLLLSMPLETSIWYIYDWLVIVINQAITSLNYIFCYGSMRPNILSILHLKWRSSIN